jgi:glycosyltransferase involved in cell wall biosynthesis
LFRPDRAAHPLLASLPKPLFLSVGRVAKEKNLEAFLGTHVAGSKVVVGDGPMLTELKARHPNVHFTGSLQGEELASAYAAADVFVFHSLTDTFGLVMVEALATGVPVAGYCVAGPLDIIGLSGRGPKGQFSERVGVLDDNLERAMLGALACNRDAAAEYGRSFSWASCTDQFEDALNCARLREDVAA